MHPQASTSSPTGMRSPSPDFSKFSQDELERLEIVLRNQVRIENEQNQRLSGLRRTMLHLQQTISYDNQRQQSGSVSGSYGLASISSFNPTTHSTSIDNMQCYICNSSVEMSASNATSSATPSDCSDCHRPVCRRCGNYTSPEPTSHDIESENQGCKSKWRCRVCIVRREVVRKSGSWNFIDDEELSMHSPVRLLQKLSAYRASAGSSSLASTPSPSPKPDRKSTILSESTNFLARLWRPQSNSSPTQTPAATPSPPPTAIELRSYSTALLSLQTAKTTTGTSSIIMSTLEKTSSSFDQLAESISNITDNSRSVSPTPKINRRMSIIREVTPKSSSTSPPAFSQPTILPSLRAQPTTSSTITDPSIDDTNSDQPGDTTSEFYSQSFETHLDSSHPEKIDEQDEDSFENYDHDRQYRYSQPTQSVITSLPNVLPMSVRLSERYHSDSQPSPEADINVSMAMDYFSVSMLSRDSTGNQSKKLNREDRFVSVDSAPEIRRRNRSGLRYSDAWARKRALMQRGYQWTTTFEGNEMNFNNESTVNNRALNETNSLPISAGLLTKEVPPENDRLCRRRSTRRLPEIPTHTTNSPNDYHQSSVSDEITLPNSQNDQSMRQNSIGSRSNRSKSIDSDCSIKTRPIHPKLAQTYQSNNAKSVDFSNLNRQKPSLVVNNSLLPQRSIDYPCIVRKAPDLSDIVRRRMLYSKISKQQGENFSLSLEREHIPKVPRKIIIRQDNSIEIALSKPPKLRRQTLSEEYYYGCNNDNEFASITQTTTATSTLGLPLPSSTSGLSMGDRRKTIETCENIFLHAEESSKLRARTPPSNPHRILLHRDKSDTSIRTNGLGMRIVGGQECEDGSLGCFVTNVLSGGPADVQGNIEVGDQILEFNGHSLIDSTYEEVRILQDHCGDIVQVVVQHNNVRLQINNGQALSSMEISRHFETVPRLASSLTRKRRNLPPLPPSMTSSFPKQQKRELFETVETLEVPNVKELKPILINRGRLLAQLWHDVEDLKLALTVIQASNLPLRANGDQPYTYITGKMIFEDRGFDMFETKIIHSSNPIYNETFVFHEVENVDVLHLEVLLWDKKQTHYERHSTRIGSNDDADEFLGMVQLPLSEASLDDEPRWYELRDRQTRKPSASSVTFKSSSAESAESGRKMPPLLASIRAQERKSVGVDFPSRLGTFMRPDPNKKQSTLHASLKINKNRINQNTNEFSSMAVSNVSPNQTEQETDDNNGRRRSIIKVQSLKLKRRISKGIYKLFDGQTRRASEMASKSAGNSPMINTQPKLAAQIPINIDTDEEIDGTINGSLDFNPQQMNKSPRASIASTTHPDDQSSPPLIRPIPLQQMPIGQLMLPYIPSSRHSSISGSRKSSAASYCESDEDIDRYFALSEQQDDQDEQTNNVQTHTVGPGQVTPRNYENMINDFIDMGKIQLGLIVTKGLLEIDVIGARGLERVIDTAPLAAARPEDISAPDTYVKTYLRTGTRRVQKRKTATVKGNYNPDYNTKLKYNACNVMGRRLQVTVWQRAGKFEKNQCIGEAFIQLDNLTLTQHTVAWYKLFREKLVESEFYDSS